jgi:hypothetical protein
MASVWSVRGFVVRFGVMLGGELEVVAARGDVDAGTVDRGDLGPRDGQ